MFPYTKPPVGTQINPLQPLSRGLVGCWLFNEGAGSLSNDLSGNKNHGQLTNLAPNTQGSGWSGSKFGGGLEFDGVDDYINTGSGASGFNILTVSTWTKPNAITGGRIVNNRNTLGAGSKWYSIMDDSVGFGYPSFTTTSYADMDIPFSLSTNSQNHIVLVVNGNNFKLYHNGALKHNQTITNLEISSVQPTLMGRLRTSDNAGVLNGSIDNVHIYNRTLSAEEIAWSYREPYAMFEPAFNPALLYSAAPPVGAIMNQFQRANIGADLYNGVFA